jgi:hypothetical protein
MSERERDVKGLIERVESEAGRMRREAEVWDPYGPAVIPLLRSRLSPDDHDAIANTLRTLAAERDCLQAEVARLSSELWKIATHGSPVDSEHARRALADREPDHD